MGFHANDVLAKDQRKHMLAFFCNIMLLICCLVSNPEKKSPDKKREVLFPSKTLRFKSLLFDSGQMA